MSDETLNDYRAALDDDGWEYFLERVAMRMEDKPEWCLPREEPLAFAEALEHQERRKHD